MDKLIGHRIVGIDSYWLIKDAQSDRVHWFVVPGVASELSCAI
jgi:hypothetical protein